MTEKLRVEISGGLGLMNILHVTATLDSTAGGPPVVITRLAAAQAALGHNVHLLSYQSPNGASGIPDAAFPFLSSPPVAFHFLASPTSLEKITAGQARKRVTKLLIDMDVVHLHGMWVPILKVAAEEALQQGVKYVITPHGMLDPWCLQQGRWKKRLALALGYRRVLNQAACLHALNPLEKDLINPLGLTCEFEVIPNGVFMEEIEPLIAPGSFYERYPELQNSPYILFLSRLHFKKGLDYLAQIFAIVASRVPDIRLVVVGPDGGSREDFRQQVLRAGLLDRVHIVGPLYGADKFAALSDALCFCLPSRQEGFSVAILEALACGLPVVISENCNFPEVADSKAGMVMPLDPQLFADGIMQLLGDANERLRMGLAGQELVRSQYVWSRVAKQFITTYQKALAA